MPLSPTSWPGGGGGASDLATVLATGNTSGGTDLALTGGSDLTLGAGSTLDPDPAGGLGAALRLFGNQLVSANPVTAFSYASLSLTLGPPDDAVLRAADGDVGESGGFVSLNAGNGNNGNSDGANVSVRGGDATTTPGTVSIRTGGGFGGEAGTTLVADGVDALVYGTLGAIKLNSHAAPADAALAAGDLYLWFDQTNGAAKLMIKAKQADGTVKTAAIALA